MRSANEMIKQYGDQADIEAAARADEYEAKDVLQERPLGRAIDNVKNNEA